MNSVNNGALGVAQGRPRGYERVHWLAMTSVYAESQLKDEKGRRLGLVGQVPKKLLPPTSVSWKNGRPSVLLPRVVNKYSFVWTAHSSLGRR